MAPSYLCFDIACAEGLLMQPFLKAILKNFFKNKTPVFSGRTTMYQQK